MEGSVQDSNRARTAAELIANIKLRIPEVAPAEIKDGLPQGAVLVDVREDGEYATGHIPEAHHIPRSYLELRIENIAPDRDTPLVLYCAGGVRSLYAAKTLVEDLGYTDVKSLLGGITLWKDGGHPVEMPKTLTAVQADRYSRHLLLP